MKISIDESQRFVCYCSYQERKIPYEAGFFFDFNYTKKWYTKDIKTAAALSDHFDEKTKKLLDSISFEKKPWSGGTLQFPMPNHLELDDVQYKAIEFAINRNHSYLALDPGLGKTPVSVVLMNIQTLIKNNSKILLIVPPFLVSNWISEIENWKTYPYDFAVLGTIRDLSEAYDITIIPDSIIKDDLHTAMIHNQKFDLVIVDEVQRFLNVSARTKALFGDGIANGLVHLAPKRVYLSGTPMRKGLMDFYPILRANAFNLIDWKRHDHYGSHFCAGYKRRTYGNNYAWDYSGSSNIKEFKAKVFGSFIMREKLEDNLKELRDKKVERIVVLDAKKAEVKKLKKLEDATFGTKTIEEITGSKELGAIARYRKEYGKTILKPALDYILNALSNSKDQMLIFGHHVDILEELGEKLSNYFETEIIYGKTKKKEIDRIKNSFHLGVTRVLVANISCMVGHNILKGTRIIFVESSWDYTENQQAIARAYRRGQKKIVVVDHLVLADSIGEYVMRTVIKKKQAIEKLN